MTRRRHRLLLLVLPAALALGGAGTAAAASPALRRCQADLGTCSADLGTCNADLSASQADLGTCNTSLGQSQANLATCTNDLAACEANASAFPASGQTTAYTADMNDGIAGPVAVPDDGTVQAGADLSYTDNGDGTITDNNTGLMWEKKSDDGDLLHDKDNIYWWTGNGVEETIWDWLEDVNMEGGTRVGFAGYSDWRLPNVKELQSIVNYENTPLAVSSAFDSGCVPGATVLTGSCTFMSVYWSSSTWVRSTTLAWGVNFNLGEVFPFGKSGTSRVRAVRGGSR